MLLKSNITHFIRLHSKTVKVVLTSAELEYSAVTVLKQNTNFVASYPDV